MAENTPGEEPLLPNEPQQHQGGGGGGPKFESLRAFTGPEDVEFAEVFKEIPEVNPRDSLWSKRDPAALVCRELLF